MTWQALAERIARMTPAERQGEVRFLEPYDDAVIHACGAEVAQEDIRDDDGAVIKQREWFLG